MAFVLNGTIGKEEIRNMFIPNVEYNLVASNFTTMETVMDTESVKIWGVGAVQTSAYSGSAVITDATDTSVTLTLDQSQYFMKSIDKVDNAQGAVKVLSTVLQRGAEATADGIDAFIFTTLAGTTNTTNPTSAAVALTASNVVAWVLDLGVKLDNLKAPARGRVLAVSPEIGAILATANMSFQTSTAEEAVKTGFLGVFGGFSIFKSTNLKVGNESTSRVCIACVPEGSYAGIGYQEYSIAEPDTSFKWLAKGLANYGAKIAQELFIVKSDAKV